jgi:F-type H+-transporting ATPase subunit a
MRLFRIILFSLLLAGLVPTVLRAQTNSAAAGSEEIAGAQPKAEPAKEEGLSPKAEEIFTIPLGSLGTFPVTNSMFVTWVVAIGVIIFARVATRRMKAVPEGAQNLLEWLVEGLYAFIESIIGAELVKKTFWFFLTIFIFILFTNWFGLIPGVGTIGWGEQGPHGFEISHPLLRGGNADLNMTFAMAAVFMLLWRWWALRSNGIWGFVLHLFGPKGQNTGFIKYMMIVIFFCVGFLELVSISFRPISLSFRLYGNVFAGENLLEAMSSVVQHPAWAKALFAALLPVPFYFLEILVGLVQAFVFMLLTTVFTALICEHDEEEHGEHAKAEH